MPGSLVRIRSKDPRYPIPVAEQMEDGAPFDLPTEAVGMVISFMDRMSHAVVLTGGRVLRVHYVYIEDLP